MSKIEEFDFCVRAKGIGLITLGYSQNLWWRVQHSHVHNNTNVGFSIFSQLKPVFVYSLLCENIKFWTDTCSSAFFAQRSTRRKLLSNFLSNVREHVHYKFLKYSLNNIVAFFSVYFAINFTETSELIIKRLSCRGICRIINCNTCLSKKLR